MPTNELNLKNRLVSMMLDHGIMTIIIFLLEVPIMVFRILSLAHAKVPLPGPFLRLSLYDVVIFSLFFNKDLFLGQSIGKRILGFQVFNNKTGEPAAPLRCLVRNFTCLLWPVEVVATLVNKERRVGDYIAGTRLGLYDSRVEARPSRIAMVACFPVAVCFTYVVWFYPIELLMKTVLAQR
jgi:uncharacterized RDD family membrane protein YckC